MNILKCKCRNKVFYCIVMLVKLLLGLPKLVFICQLSYLSVLREEMQSFCQGLHNAQYNVLLQPLSGTDSMTDSTSIQLKPLPHNSSNNHRHRHAYGNYELNTYEISSNVKCFFSHLVPHVEFFSLIRRISQKTFQRDFHENGKVPTTRLGSLPWLHKCIYINQSVVTISQQKMFVSK